MALDIWILSKTGQPVKYVEIDVYTHSFMWNWKVINQNDFPLLSRMDNYYEDADFLPDEIGKLLAELKKFVLRTELHPVSQLRMERFINIAQEALTNGVGLSVVAD